MEQYYTDSVAHMSIYIIIIMAQNKHFSASCKLLCGKQEASGDRNLPSSRLHILPLVQAQ